MVFDHLRLSCDAVNTVFMCKFSIKYQFASQKKKVQVGKDQEKAQSEKDFHSKNQGGKKKQTNNQVLIP